MSITTYYFTENNCTLQNSSIASNKQCQLCLGASKINSRVSSFAFMAASGSKYVTMSGCHESGKVKPCNGAACL